LKKYILGILFLSVLIINGCVPSKPTEEVEILPSERLISKLEANRRKISNFEGYGTITVKSRDINNSATFKVTLIKPDSILLTIMGPFGIELAQTLVTKDKFMFYDVLQNTAYEGETNDNILKNIFRIDLSFSDLMDAFIGSVNLTKHLYKSPTKYSIDDDQYLLTYVDTLSGETTNYKVDIKQLGITDYKLLNSDGNVILSGKYSRFNNLENVAVPYSIEVQNKKEGQLVTIEYKQMSANKNDVSIDFRLPGDATVIKW
jgi:outer membrane biogenesis lipoprotein LolB